MKIVTCLLANILIIILLSDFVYSTEIGIGGLKKGRSAHKKLRVTENSDEAYPTQKNELPDMPIYYKGWIKYLHYTNKDKDKPKAFWKNAAFEKQFKAGISGDKLKLSDKDGFINIPSAIAFYTVLYKDTINIFNSRNGYTNTVDSLDLINIKAIPEDDQFRGGIKDFGKFDEGFCFKIQAKIPNRAFKLSVDTPEPQSGVDQLWVICLDKESDKVQLMNVIINLKLKLQHAAGIYLEANPAKEQKEEVSVANPNDIKNSTVDGYWMLLQDWTQCTLKCGGGLQYQQMMCVPPKKGGKECQGPAIRTRPCNIEPCPQVSVLKKAINPLTQANNSTLAPIVKMMAISKRPQRYDKCFIKETDALMEKDDVETQSLATKPKIPVRLVLNDRTVSAYLDDTLTNKLVTFNLGYSTIVRISEDKRCFRIKSNSKSAMFCQLDSGSGDFVEEWDYDFNLFKNQCRKKREKSDVLMPEEKKLEQEFKNRVEGVKTEMVMEIAEKNKEKVEQNEEKQLTMKVQQVQSTSMMAIQKETKLEDLLEKEEAAKEDVEMKTLETQIQSEKKKEECLNKVIKEKEVENQMNIAKTRAEEAIQKIQEQTKKDIAMKRFEIKKKIMEMRKKQQRKKAALNSEIMTIRSTIANKLNKMSKAGNQSNCSSTSTEVIRQNYCNANFADNYIKYQDCNTEASFCYVCCENEFGDFHIVERDRCYANCDKASA